MLETRTLITSSAKLEPDDLHPVLLTLSTEGWEPAILESERTFVQLAGVTDKVDLLTLRRPADRIRRRLPIVGDVFFRESDVYYIVINLGESGIRFGVRVSGYEGEEPTLEIGVISSDPSGLDKRLKLFADSVDKAIKSSLDGRKTRHMTFEWRELKPGAPRLDRITTIRQEESETKFARAKLNPKEIKAARVLSTKLAREILIELSQAGFARERDVLSRRAKLKDQVKEVLGALKKHKLVQAEFLLECKQTGMPLTRLSDREQLEEGGVATLICHSCGANFNQETLSEGYSVSELGQRMSRQSHWMTVWITDLLTKLGVPEDAILWNISEHGEEVDLLVGFLEQLWIFELKDREFGAGDAYALNYRQVRYRVNKAIIVTTEKVSRDAKRVFEELRRQAVRVRSLRGGESPVYIEGLNKAENALRREISTASLGYAHRKLAMIGESSGYNLGAVLAARFGEPIQAVGGITTEEIR